MHETPDDLRTLQQLLDTSHAAMGEHMREIFTEDRRLSAEALAQRLTGVCVLDLGTVSAAGEPRVAPVDGLFFRGQWYFGSAPTSTRFRHITARPAVSASHTRGEALGVIVHGTARRVEAEGAFRDFLGEIYGEGWNEFGPGAWYAAIDARRMYTLVYEPD